MRGCILTFVMATREPHTTSWSCVSLRIATIEWAPCLPTIIVKGREVEFLVSCNMITTMTFDANLVESSLHCVGWNTCSWRKFATGFVNYSVPLGVQFDHARCSTDTKPREEDSTNYYFVRLLLSGSQGRSQDFDLRGADLIKYGISNVYTIFKFQ
jgi:hypothetical protein